MLGSIVAPGELEQHGAVIFGQQARLRASRILKPVISSRRRQRCQLKEQLSSHAVNKENKDVSRKVRSRDEEEDSDLRNNFVPWDKASQNQPYTQVGGYIRSNTNVLDNVYPIASQSNCNATRSPSNTEPE